MAEGVAGGAQFYGPTAMTDACSVPWISSLGFSLEGACDHNGIVALGHLVEFFFGIRDKSV